MDWETPPFVEVKMDAEINSYQDDFAGPARYDRAVFGRPHCDGPSLTAMAECDDHSDLGVGSQGWDSPMELRLLFV